MKKIILSTILCLVSGAAAAQENVLQLFACNLSEGKTYENVWQTLEMLASESKASGELEPGFGIFLWLPHRGSLNYDYVWGITSTDLNTMAQGTAAYYGSGMAQILEPRFADLGRCNSSVNFSEQIHSGVVGTTEDRQLDAIVETFSCQFKDGSDMDDIKSAVAFWQEQMDKIEGEATDTYEAFLVTPFRGIRQGIDFAWIGTYPDIITFAQGSTDYLASKPGQAADERFAKVSTCQSALWAGFWVLTPPDQM